MNFSSPNLHYFLQTNKSSINLHIEAKEHMYIHFHLLVRYFEEEDCSILQYFKILYCL